jgi:hypothetical protein
MSLCSTDAIWLIFNFSSRNPDPSQIGVFRADTANDALLYAALSSQLFSPSAPVANATLVASYLADFRNRTDSVDNGYPTVEGATAGRRKVSSPPLLVDLVAADALASSATDAALTVAIDKQLRAFRDADVRVFIFLCPVGACHFFGVFCKGSFVIRVFLILSDNMHLFCSYACRYCSKNRIPNVAVGSVWARIFDFTRSASQV